MTIVHVFLAWVLSPLFLLGRAERELYARFQPMIVDIIQRAGRLGPYRARLGAALRIPGHLAVEWHVEVEVELQGFPFTVYLAADRASVALAPVPGGCRVPLRDVLAALAACEHEIASLRAMWSRAQGDRAALDAAYAEYDRRAAELTVAVDGLIAAARELGERRGLAAGALGAARRAAAELGPRFAAMEAQFAGLAEQRHAAVIHLGGDARPAPDEAKAIQHHLAAWDERIERHIEALAAVGGALDEARGAAAEAEREIVDAERHLGSLRAQAEARRAHATELAAGCRDLGAWWGGAGAGEVRAWFEQTARGVAGAVARLDVALAETSEQG
jgi:hypothetical protein